MFSKQSSQVVKGFFDFSLCVFLCPGLSERVSHSALWQASLALCKGLPITLGKGGSGRCAVPATFKLSALMSHHYKLVLFSFVQELDSELI